MIDLHSMKRYLAEQHKTALLVTRPSLTVVNDKEVEALEYRMVVNRDPMIYTAIYYAPVGTDEENAEEKHKAFDRLHWEAQRDLHIDFDMDELLREGDAYRASLGGQS